MRAARRLIEPRVVERLEQVVDRRELERAQRVAIVGGHEDDRRHPLGADRAHHVEPGELGHLVVEQHEIRSAGQDRLEV